MLHQHYFSIFHFMNFHHLYFHFLFSVSSFFFLQSAYQHANHEYHFFIIIIFSFSFLLKCKHSHHQKLQNLWTLLLHMFPLQKLFWTLSILFSSFLFSILSIIFKLLLFDCIHVKLQFYCVNFYHYYLLNHTKTVHYNWKIYMLPVPSKIITKNLFWKIIYNVFFSGLHQINYNFIFSAVKH